MKNNFSKIIFSDKTVSSFFISAFFYTLLTSLIFQLIIFPHLPSISTPLGILKGDNELFHRLAVEMSDNIHKDGWGAWKLFPLNIAAGINVGFLAVLYVLFGIHPFLIIPINALLHTLSFIIYFKIFFLLAKDKWMALLAAAPFLLMPSTLLWTSQLHKDNYAILAWALLFYSLIQLKDGATIKLALYNAFGIILLLLVRPLYLHLLLAISLLLFTLYLGLYFRKLVSLKTLSNSFVLFAMSAIAYVFFAMWSPVYSANDESHFYVSSEANLASSAKENLKKCLHYVWEDSDLPPRIETQIKAVAGIRMKQLCFIPGGTTSTIDIEFLPNSSKAIVQYAPRALAITQLYPTPYQLLKINKIQTLPVLLEMLLFYCFLPFSLYYVWKNKSLELFSLILPILFCEIFLAYIIPNMGSFHRIRYPFFSVILGLGVLSFLKCIGWRKVENKKI